MFPENYHSETFPPIVVSIGDLLSYWTHRLLRTTVHRIVLAVPVGDGGELIVAARSEATEYEAAPL